MVKLPIDYTSDTQLVTTLLQRYVDKCDGQLGLSLNDLNSPLRQDAYQLFESLLKKNLKQPDFEHVLNNVALDTKANDNSVRMLLSQIRLWWQEWYFALSMAKQATSNVGGSVIKNKADVTDSSWLPPHKPQISHYASLFNQVPIPLCNVCTITGNIIRINQRFIDTFGYTLHDIPTLNIWWQRAYPDAEYRDWVKYTWLQATQIARMNATDIEPQNYQVTCNNGMEITMEISGITIDSEFLAIFKDVTQRIAAEDILRDMAFLDSLTGIANRRHFDHKFADEFEHAKKHEHPLSMILIDIDYFKQYNDNYGHIKGDECLCIIAQCISTSTLNSNDFVARFGGEEFVVLLPDSDSDIALKTAFEIQQAISLLAITHEYTDTGYVSLSMGVKTLDVDNCSDQRTFIDAADKALYQAKGQGRDCIVVCEEDVK